MQINAKYFQSKKGESGMKATANKVQIVATVAANTITIKEKKLSKGKNKKIRRKSRANPSQQKTNAQRRKNCLRKLCVEGK